MNRQSYVTLATNEEYGIGALVLAASLRQTNTVKELTVLVTEGITDAFRRLLGEAYDNVIEVQRIKNPDSSAVGYFGRPELLNTFTKIQCWSLIQFEKAVYLDADTVVLHNIDELFERDELSAVPDPNWPDCFNTGVFVYRPSLETLKALRKLASEGGSFDGGDQGLLNSHFSKWLVRGISQRLSYVYNCICRITDECGFDFYTSTPAWVKFGGAIRVAHFAGPIKPWHRVSAARDCNKLVCLALLNTKPERRGISRTAGMLAYWWSLFLILVRPKLSPDMLLGDFHLQPSSVGNDFQNHQSSAPELSPFAPYVPSFQHSDEWNEKSYHHRPPSPPRMIPYHPEFHETRWEDLHYGQRTDQSNRFPQYHEVPRKEFAPPLAFSCSYLPSTPKPPPPSPPHPHLPHPTPHVVSNANQTAFFFSPPPAPTSSAEVRPQSPSPIPIPTPNEECDIKMSNQTGTTTSETHSVEQPQSAWQPEPEKPPEPHPKFSLECHRCCKELATEPANVAKSKPQRSESRRSDLHKKISQKSKQVKRTPLQKHTGSVSVEPKNGRFIAQRTVSHYFIPSHVRNSVTPDAAQYPVTTGQTKRQSSDRASRMHAKSGSLKPHQNDGTHRKTTVSIGPVQKTDRSRLTKNPSSPKPRRMEALDLAVPLVKGSRDNIKRQVRTRLEPHNLEVPTNTGFEGIPCESFEPQWNGTRSSAWFPNPQTGSGFTPIVDVLATEDSSETVLLNSRELPYIYDQLGSRTSDEVTTALILQRSKRRSLRELRRAQDKLKERGFDRQVAQATWENKEKVDELCRLMSSVGISKPGVPGQLATIGHSSQLCHRHELIETERMYAWERGEIDYMGTDRFANILAKLCQTMSKSGCKTNFPVGLDLN